MTLRFAVVVAMILFTTGCFGVPHPEEVAKIDFGSPPENYETKIKQIMSTQLFDPYSAVYSCWTPCKAATVTPLWIGSHTYGWGVQCSINAKNRFGGYVGAKDYMFFFDLTGAISNPVTSVRCIY